jgi:hypothetical protein
MVRWLGCLLCCTAIFSGALLAAPGAASAQGKQMQYTTAITAVYGSKYPLTGHLDLEVFPDGTLRGYYHTSYYKLYIPVAGGQDGDYMWFDIGPSSVDLGLNAGPHGKLHFVGTTNSDGTFRGQIYPETTAVLSGLSMQQEQSPPGPTPDTNDQYVMTGTPSETMEPTPGP